MRVLQAFFGVFLVQGFFGRGKENVHLQVGDHTLSSVLLGIVLLCILHSTPLKLQKLAVFSAKDGSPIWTCWVFHFHVLLASDS